MSNSTQTPGEMPERYRPDPWIDSEYGCRSGQNSTVLRMPTIAVRDWLTLIPGDYVGVAPCGPRSVWVGQSVPRALDDAKTTTQTDRETHMIYLPTSVARYLDVDEGDTLRYHRPGRSGARPRVKVERLPRDDEQTDEDN